VLRRSLLLKFHPISIGQSMRLGGLPRLDCFHPVYLPLIKIGHGLLLEPLAVSDESSSGNGSVRLIPLSFAY
jgi:hypothetical protein